MAVYTHYGEEAFEETSCKLFKHNLKTVHDCLVYLEGDIVLINSHVHESLGMLSHDIKSLSLENTKLCSL
jgi:hypothetical protein